MNGANALTKGLVRYQLGRGHWIDLPEVKWTQTLAKGASTNDEYEKERTGWNSKAVWYSTGRFAATP